MIKQYDLRYRNLPWVPRDYLVGAARADAPELSRLKSRVGKTMLFTTGALALAGLLFHLF